MESLGHGNKPNVPHCKKCVLLHILGQMIQSNLHNNAVKSKSSAGTLWIAKNPRLIQKDSKDESNCADVQADLAFS